MFTAGTTAAVVVAKSLTSSTRFASLAWAFNITSSVPAEETDTLAFTSAANSHPLPFEACVPS